MVAEMTAQPARQGFSRAGRRRHSRLRVCLPAKLVTLGGTLHVTLLDLSFRGAKLATGGFLTPGSDAVLSWGRFEAFCRIAWCHGDYCGLDFDEPLDPDVLIATRDFADATPPTNATRQAARNFVWGSARL